MHNKQIEYIPALTSLRGVAALWVMLFHLDVLTFYRDLGNLVPRESTGLVTKGYLWVDFFFVLSGFIIRYNYLEVFSNASLRSAAGTYLRARFWRVYPLHAATLVFLALFAVAMAVWLPQVREDSSWPTFFDSVAFFQSLFLINAHNLHDYLAWNIVSWSIGAEWWTYVVAIALFILRNKSDVIVAGLLLVLGYLGLYALVYGIKGGSLDITFDYGFARCLAGFSIGFALHIVYQNRGLASLFCADWFAVGVLIGITLGLHFVWPDMLIHIFMSALVLAAANNRSRLQRIMALRLPHWLGQVSYSIYLVHGVVFMVAWVLLPMVKAHWHIAHFSTVQHLGLWFTFSVSTLVISKITYVQIERRFRQGLRFRSPQTVS